jgi:hypothetical protein
VGAILLGALELEKDPEVQVALAVNLLASGGHVAADGSGLLHIHERARKTLSLSSLPTPSEALAVRTLVLALEDAAPGETTDAGAALEGLRRFWDE